MIHRRSFIRHAAVAPAFLRHLISAPRSNTVRLASFGAGNMAWYTLDGIATHPSVKLVCVAEVDAALLERVKRKYPDIRVYDDWRKMIDREHRNLDAACVGTPDHMHAPMSMSAMRLGLHVYTQKPLTHDIHETRRLADMARKKRLVTQMGIQIHSAKEYRTAVALIHAGAIGKVTEVHSWSNKKWGEKDLLPARTDPTPPTLDWNGWLGVENPRPFITGCYHPVNWRKRMDFGTATFGDMGCHILDPVFSALDLRAPLSVRSEGAPPNGQSWALDSVIHYQFPGGVKLTWYDGDQLPPEDVRKVVGSIKMPQQGSIFLGSGGAMLLAHIGMPVLLPEDRFKGYAMPQFETSNHYHQFVDAVLEKDKTSAPFEYAGPLTETVLLGPIATRFPNTTLEWNAAKMKFNNSAEASHHVRRGYRDGWKVKGLS